MTRMPPRSGRYTYVYTHTYLVYVCIDIYVYRFIYVYLYIPIYVHDEGAAKDGLVYSYTCAYAFVYAGGLAYPYANTCAVFVVLYDV